MYIIVQKLQPKFDPSKLNQIFYPIRYDLNIFGLNRIRLYVWVEFE